MDEARNFKFGILIELGKSHLEHDKLTPKSVWLQFSDQKLNFKPPSVNLERVKIENLNLVYGYILASPMSRVTEYHKKGRGQGPGSNF